MPITEYSPHHDIVIPQGATWRETYTYALNEDGTDPIDISDFTPRGHIRTKKAKDSQLIAMMVFDVSDADVGTIVASLAASVTDTIGQSGYYDIELHGTGSDPEVIRLVQGQAFLDTEVTN